MIALSLALKSTGHEVLLAGLTGKGGVARVPKNLPSEIWLLNMAAAIIKAVCKEMIHGTSL
jgi:hypothetical protein